MEYKYYDTGLGTLNALLNGEVDVAAPVGEYALVGKIFGKEPIKTIGAIDKVDYQTLVARKDHGIENISDLKGKTLGVIQKTQEEFYLTRFLELNGIKVDEVTLANIPLSECIDAISNGEVDAIVLVPPYIDNVKNSLANDIVSWPVQANQMTQQLMVCKGEFIEQQPELINRLLKSLAKAQDYLVRNPDSAKTIVKERLNLTKEDVARIWSQNQYGLSLDESLIVAMEDEARWMINNGLTDVKDMPDFLDYVYEDALIRIKPEAVNVIR